MDDSCDVGLHAWAQEFDGLRIRGVAEDMAP